MFRLKRENLSHLEMHNIKISELKTDAASVSSFSMDAQPPKKVIHLSKLRMLTRGGRSSSGIRITNVKNIKPPDPEMVKKQEEDKLRAQLQKEIAWRSRTCAHAAYACAMAVSGAGRRHCARHEPGRRCAHAAPSGQRCALPALPVPNSTAPADGPHNTLCFEHARAAMYARHRSTAPPPPVTTTETLLNQLQHYVRPERTRTTSCASSVSVVSDPAEQEQNIPHAVDPFRQIDATVVNAAHSAAILECHSGSGSDADSVTLGEGGDCRIPPSHDGHSDAELSGDEASPLWRAGVYTAEEAVREARDVLLDLQHAYLRQMGRLRILLQMSRSNYLKTLKAEKEQYCSINTQARSGPLTVRERRQLRKLKAYASYHRKHGVDAVLARKLHHKRAKLNKESTWTSRVVAAGGGVGAGRCVWVELGARCGAASLPAARLCRRHVLHDHHQVLFSACGDIRGGVPCREPIPKLPLPSAKCPYHTSPPTYTVFSLKKYDTDSESGSHSSSDSLTEDAGEQSVEERVETLDEQTIAPTYD